MSSTTPTQPDLRTRCTVEACRDDPQLRGYIDEHWRAGHILARDERMFAFTYRTPWVNRTRFPGGTSVLCIYDDDRLLGFLGTFITPYPRPESYWLALWHVLPELKGTGLGGALLREMQSRCESVDGWIGTFGAGPEAVPVYLKRGYAVRAVRRWVYDPQTNPEGACRAVALHSSERPPDDAWHTYRYDRHPIFEYDRRAEGVFRTEQNAWGVVTHCCRLNGNPRATLDEIHRDGARLARASGVPHLLDAWAFDCPGAGWTLAAEDLPSVFHPPSARGNLIYASGRPFVPSMVTKGDCDQDRPN